MYSYNAPPGSYSGGGAGAGGMPPPPPMQDPRKYAQPAQQQQIIVMQQPGGVAGGGASGGVADTPAEGGYHATCPFCHEKNSDFESAKRLNKHYANNCPILNRCQWCKKAVEVRGLHEHWMSACSFLKSQGDGILQRCPVCTVPCSQEDYNKHQRGVNCAKRPPRPGAKWCPLCDVEVSPDTDQAWRDHLIGPTGCGGNERRMSHGWTSDRKMQ